MFHDLAESITDAAPPGAASRGLLSPVVLLRRVLLLAILAGTLAIDLGAQPVPFGSADDPWEQMQRVWWRRDNTLSTRGSLALLGPQWYAGSTVAAGLVTRWFTAHVEAVAFANTIGFYTPYFDEPYDVLRAVHFARYTPPTGMPVHLRFGPVDRLRLGTAGHLVDAFNSRAAWDERTVGVEFYAQTRYGTVSAFADNLLFDGAVGVHYALRPFRRQVRPRLSSLVVGLTAVADVDRWNETVPGLAGVAAEAQFDLFAAGTVRLSPFVSFATYLDHGSGLAAGADFHSDNFADVARFRVRLALYYNGDQFISGHVGPFYTVSSAHSRILDSGGLIDVGAPSYAGVVLSEALGGPDLVTELRFLFFESFEFWYSFRRHYGSQRLSTMNLRLFVRSPGGFRFQIGQNRAGLQTFRDLFTALNEQTSLVFRADYPFTRRIWLYLRARYTYELLDEAPDGTQLFLEQRRFEPSLGYRFFF